MKGFDKKNIFISYEVNDYKKIIKRNKIIEWVKNVFIELDIESSSCSIILTDNDKIIKLNKKYFSKKSKTDVISFSQIEGEKIDFIESNFIGEIIISVQFAIEYSKEKKHSVELEIKYLILHGILHLLGYDHEIDNGEMFKTQNNIFKKLIGVKIG